MRQLFEKSVDIKVTSHIGIGDAMLGTYFEYGVEQELATNRPIQ
jgi:hypothetical protein